MFYKVLQTVTCNKLTLIKGSVVELNDDDTAKALGAEYLEQVEAPEDNSNAVENASDKQVKTSKKK